MCRFWMKVFYYTIPRNNRELQRCTVSHGFLLIIPYQEIIGNYSLHPMQTISGRIIPYQEIIGNYSPTIIDGIPKSIIPYQEIIGNYSDHVGTHTLRKIIPRNNRELQPYNRYRLT